MSTAIIKGKIGQQLLAAGLITEEQLQTALFKQRETKGFLGDVLVKMGLVKAELVGQLLSASLGISYVNLATTPIDSAVVDLISEEFQRLHSLIPYKREGSSLFTAMHDPVNVKIIDHIELMTGLKVVPVLALYDNVQEAFNRIYTLKHMADSVLREIEDLEHKSAEPELTADQLENMADDAPIIRLVNSIISGAVNSDASDVHIEPQEKIVRVRYRIDGVLFEQMTYAPLHHPAVVSRIKIMSHLNIVERRRPQDGRIGFHIENLQFDLRVSTMQMVHGEKVVLRILNHARIGVPVEQVGFSPEQLSIWNSFLQRPHGVILVTGPTGSGKSTTLYASLGKINEKSRNIVTIEDPVEYNVPGLNQAQVNNKIDVSFANGLRAIVRQDPDVIMVGEIRDAETAEVAIQAALTGHLVFSTLHTNDAPSALVRLKNLGIEEFLISSAVVGVVAQRLLRRVCTGCAQDVEPDEEMAMALRLSKEQLREGRFRQGCGCGKCGGRGYSGRLAVFEMMPVNGRIRELLRQKADGAILKQAALQEGMMTLREAGIQKAMAGETTLHEVCRVLMDEEYFEQSQKQLRAA